MVIRGANGCICPLASIGQRPEACASMRADQHTFAPGSFDPLLAHIKCNSRPCPRCQTERSLPPTARVPGNVGQQRRADRAMRGRIMAGQTSEELLALFDTAQL